MSNAAWRIGWDVGGWHCEKGKSRDAIVILDTELEIFGSWRGNLRDTINSCSTSAEWTAALFDLCQSGTSPESGPVILAIDTPLGFSEAFVQLLTQRRAVTSINARFRTNPYLLRHTERFLFERNFRPLSAVQDQIGSQATKGMHFLARFAPDVEECGIWSDSHDLTVIEAYPSPSNQSGTIQDMRQRYSPLPEADREDALTCALVAHLFAEKREDLEPPEQDVSSSEGWIWVPKDAFFQDVL